MSQRACHVYIQVTNEINVFSHFHDANNAKKMNVFILFNYIYAAQEKKVYFWWIVQNVFYFSKLK